MGAFFLYIACLYRFGKDFLRKFRFQLPGQYDSGSIIIG